MAALTLSTDDVTFGRAVLLATDALGMRAEGAFWLYDSREVKWRYFLITSLFNSLGSREIYQRLNGALVSEPHEVRVALDRENTKALVYRMASPSDDRTARRAKTSFRKLSNELIAA
jgi:hypothetical protein